MAKEELEPIVTDEQGTELAGVEIVQKSDRSKVINCIYFPRYCNGPEDPKGRGIYCEVGKETDCPKYQAIQEMHSAHRAAEFIWRGR